MGVIMGSEPRTEPLFALAEPAPQLDSRVRVVTPENIAFEYRVAGPFARIGAYLLDLLVLGAICLGLLAIATLVGAAVGAAGVGWMTVMIGGFVAYWFYGGLFEWLRNGQTPGKRMTGLRVLRTDGRPIAAWQAILRNLLRYIDLFPYTTAATAFGEDSAFFWPTCLVGMVAMACTPRYQRIGDLACNTMVVAEETGGSKRAEKDWLAAGEATRDPALQQVLALLPASYRPGRTLARALSHYAGRRRHLGPARRKEIAEHVGGPLVESLGLPAETDRDLLLCALYARAFLSDQEASAEAAAIPEPTSTPTDSGAAPAAASEPRFIPDPDPPSEVAPNALPTPGSPEFRALQEGRV